jgi:hypothetical protein
LQESADGRKKDTLKALARVKSSRNAEVVRKVRYIKSLLEQVDNAESRNEWRQADSLAEHALILAQELPGVN